MEVIIKGKQGEGKSRAAEAIAQSWAETNNVKPVIYTTYAPFGHPARVAEKIAEEGINVVIFEEGFHPVHELAAGLIIAALPQNILIIYITQS